MNNWNLDDLYLGFDDKYKSDISELSNLVDDYKTFLVLKNHSDIEYVEGYISF